MATAIERIDAVCTIIVCKQRLLLVYNEGWGAFMLPVTKLRRQQVGLPASATRWELGEEAASRNVAECLWHGADRLPNLLMDFGALRQSDRSGNVNHYAFQLFCFEVDEPVAGPGVVCQWLTVDEILDPDRQSISPTVRVLLNALNEAALSRKGSFPLLTSGTPRTSRSSIAIIRDADRSENRWLCQWNSNWGRYFLVGGHQHDTESAEDCMVREIKEELELSRESDYRMQARQSLQYTDWSTSAWRMTEYDVSTFDVQLTNDAIEKIKKDPANRWVTEQEIRSERCLDDKLISSTARRLLASIGELSEAPSEWHLRRATNEKSTAGESTVEQPAYTPKPIDTGNIELSPEIIGLTERLARNIHEVWAAARMAEGWTYGPERNDSRKKHPCLVPYDDLPDSEKQYDRDTAMETLKVITALGQRIGIE